MLCSTCSLVEQVDLDKRTVRTLAGNGTKAEQDYVGGQRGAAQLLNSPWDLAIDARVGCLTQVQDCTQHEAIAEEPSHGSAAFLRPLCPYLSFVCAVERPIMTLGCLMVTCAGGCAVCGHRGAAPDLAP